MPTRCGCWPVEVRSKFIIHRPAFMLGVIQLVRPDFLVESK
jgi:hypothetical protein